MLDNMEEYDERLKIETSIGTLYGLFERCEFGYIAWFENKPTVGVIFAESLTEAIKELLISLDCILRYENKNG